MSLATALTDAGGAISDLFAASGSSKAAQSYTQASQIAGQNEKLAINETNIKEAQTSRQIYQTIGTQEAQVGGAGLAESGSALDLLKSSQSQGALTKAMVREEGVITANSYAEQAGLYAGLSGAASATSTAQTIGGIVQGAGAAYQGYKALTGYTSAGAPIYSSTPVLDSSVFGAGAAADVGSADVAAGVGAAAGVTDTGLAVGGASAAGIGAAADIAGAGVGVDAAGAAIGADVGAGVAAGDIAAGAGAAADAGAAAGIGDVLIGLVSWVVCTELHKQGRLPTRWYVPGARRFARYSDQDKAGYYVWAVPATKHLRAHPDSWFSKVLEWVFNHRAEYIAAQAGIRGARKTVAGVAMLAGVHALCWTLARTMARRPIDWKVLYRA